MIIVEFFDNVHEHVDEEFSTFAEAQEFWDAYADSETCYSGVMWDADTGEIIWEF